MKNWLVKILWNKTSSQKERRNFRNNLLINRTSKVFKDFESLIEDTWGGIKIHELVKEDSFLSLHMRDRDFVTEVYNMGHGVQMWLQTMWFLSCAEYASIIVLDEPDVYMHADLQRQLIRLLKGEDVKILRKILGHKLFIHGLVLLGMLALYGDT